RIVVEGGRERLRADLQIDRADFRAEREIDVELDVAHRMNGGRNAGERDAEPGKTGAIEVHSDPAGERPVCRLHRVSRARAAWIRINEPVRERGAVHRDVYRPGSMRGRKEFEMLVVDPRVGRVGAVDLYGPERAEAGAGNDQQLTAIGPGDSRRDGIDAQ